MVVASIILISNTAKADTGQVSLPPPPRTTMADTAQSAGSDNGFFGSWLDKVSQIQSEQPHWVTPLVTVTPRLEQEVRYDQMWESSAGNKNLDSNGGGKGIEFIPLQNTEVIVGVPAYQTRNKPKGEDGFADENFLLKYRVLSTNEQNGDYILTAFLGISAPTGEVHNSADHEVTTPTLAFGKGWGNFDIQDTLGVQIPDNGAAHTGNGTPIVSNTTFQYRFLKYFSPEVEFNYTYWPNGERERINQLYITPGVVLGKFDFGKRLGLTVGIGCQIAATTRSQYNHNVIMSVRVPF
jgi:hypothetical protein